uniref:Uncharacterized protein n=1 Tax=Romanomermis culicivorax TaxID=13658 RepID=A0A915IIY3_ROMCU
MRLLGECDYWVNGSWVKDNRKTTTIRGSDELMKFNHRQMDVDHPQNKAELSYRKNLHQFSRMSGQTPASGGAAAANSYVCPSDRHLALRAQLKAGWSVRSGGDVSSALKAPGSTNSLSETELEQIKNVLAKAEKTEKQEQERVG